MQKLKTMQTMILKENKFYKVFNPVNCYLENKMFLAKNSFYNQYLLKQN
jgi:hypothetical protein